MSWFRFGPHLLDSGQQFLSQRIAIIVYQPSIHKAMLKYFDFALQTAAIVTPFATDLLGLHTAVFIALLIGPIQLVSSSLSVLKEAPLLRYKSLHLALSAAFFVFFFAGAALGIIVRDSVYQLTFPLMLAAYYYGLTTIWVFFYEPRTRNSIRDTRLTS